MRIEDIHQYNFPKEINLIPKATNTNHSPTGLTPGNDNGDQGLGLHNNYTFSHTQLHTLPANSYINQPKSLFDASGQSSITHHSPNFNAYGAPLGSIPFTSNPSQEIFYSTFTIYVKVLITKASGVNFESDVKDLIGVTRVILKSTNGLDVNSNNGVVSLFPLISQEVKTNLKPFSAFNSQLGVISYGGGGVSPVGNVIPLARFFVNLLPTDATVLRYVTISTIVKFNM